MEQSILTSTKKMLGVEDDQTAFDLEVTTHINSAISSLSQVITVNAAHIEDAETKWDALGLPPVQLDMAKTFIFKKVKLAFDPPGTSYLIEAAERQIKEEEWRLKEFSETDEPNEEVTV